MIHRISSSLSSAAKSSARLPATEAAAAATTPTILPSLGASGAIYSTVIISTLAFPDAEVSLVFPPTPSFPIEYGVGGLVLLDCIGVLRGWRYVDTNLRRGITDDPYFFCFLLRDWQVL
jgi:rhomboid-like protein